MPKKLQSVIRAKDHTTKWCIVHVFFVLYDLLHCSTLFYLLFSLYIDELFLLLKESGMGCHVGLTYAGAFGYADDIALVAPSLSSLKQMIQICEQFAESHSITFNPSKTKLLCFNMKLESKVPPIYLNGERVSIVENEKHLGNYVSTDIEDRNIIADVCDL